MLIQTTKKDGNSSKNNYDSECSINLFLQQNSTIKFNSSVCKILCLPYTTCLAISIYYLRCRHLYINYLYKYRTTLCTMYICKNCWYICLFSSKQILMSIVMEHTIAPKYVQILMEASFVDVIMDFCWMRLLAIVCTKKR